MELTAPGGVKGSDGVFVDTTGVALPVVSLSGSPLDSRSYTRGRQVQRPPLLSCSALHSWQVWAGSRSRITSAALEMRRDMSESKSPTGITSSSAAKLPPVLIEGIMTRDQQTAAPELRSQAAAASACPTDPSTAPGTMHSCRSIYSPPAGIGELPEASHQYPPPSNRSAPVSSPKIISKHALCDVIRTRTRTRVSESA